MRFKSLLSFIVCCICLGSISAQENTGNSTPKYLLKLTPLKTIGFVNPGLEVCLEQVHSNKTSLQIMASYLWPFNMHSEYPKDVKGFRTAIEYRIYKHENAPFGRYIAFEADFMNKQYNHQIKFYTPNNGITRDEITSTKKMGSFSVKWGKQIALGKFFLDYYVGVGIRYVDLTHNKATYPAGGSVYEEDGFFRGSTNEEGSWFTLSLPLNARIGYIF